MPRNSSAFTRVELLALVAALGLLALCTWPALAGSRGDAQRATCFNNLRQIAHGAQIWAGDHGDRIPWLTPIAEGGTFTNNLHASAAWFELLTFSNELSSPRLLACPADEGVKVASAWLGGAGALTATGYRQNSVSYLIGLHAHPNSPKELLCADRNVQPSRTSTCGLAFVSACPSLDSPDPGVRWTNAVHGLSGHITTVDGAVIYGGATGWRNFFAAFGTPQDTGFSLHTLRDR